MNLASRSLPNPREHASPVHLVEFLDWDLFDCKLSKPEAQRQSAAGHHTRNASKKCESSEKVPVDFYSDFGRMILAYGRVA